MAINVPNTRENPQFVVVSDYSVQRLGKYPLVAAGFEECVYLTGTPLPVLAHDTSDVLVVAPFAGAAESVGAKVLDPASNVLGEVTAAQEVTTGEGEEAVTLVHLTLDTPVSPTPDDLRLVERLPTGADAYRRARSGNRWILQLDGTHPTQMARIASMLVTAYMNAVTAVLDKLQLSVDPQDLAAAILELAGEGVTVDAILAEQAEQMEMDRRAGTLTDVDVQGTAS